MISIIIPTLNEENVIADTIARLKPLTLPHEIIVSDGASQDRTVTLAQQAGAQVVKYTGPTRQTIAAGRNEGARLARGKFLVFFDADCWVADPDDFFRRALARFAREPRLVAVTAHLRVNPETETWADRLGFGWVNWSFSLANNIFRRGAAAGEFQMIRRGAFEKLGGYREKLVASEDIDMFFRLSRIGLVRSLSELIVYHSGRRVHRVGWPRLLNSWFWNTVWITFFNRAYSKEWTPIR